MLSKVISFSYTSVTSSSKILSNLSNTFNFSEEKQKLYYPKSVGIAFSPHNVDTYFEALVFKEWAMLTHNNLLKKYFKNK